MIWLALLENVAVAVALASRGMPGVEAALLMLLAPLMLVAALYVGLKNRKIRLRSSYSSLSEDPDGFWRKVWFYVGFYILISVGVPLAALGRHARFNNWG